MGFAFNPSLNHINISEQYIADIYRSKSELLLPDVRFKGHTCEAYICITKVEKKMNAYVALLETGMKSVFVYTSDYSTENSADYPRVLAEADAFLKSMGFSMERINLDFSPAMREVIIKGLRVMRPPVKKQVLRSLSSQKSAPVSAPAAPQSPPEKPAHTTNGPGTLQTELKSLQTELASTKAVIEKITREKLALEQSASREIAVLKSAAEKAVELKRICEERLANEIEALKKEKPATVSAQHDDLLIALKVELDAAQRNTKAVESASSAKISILNKKIVSLENDKQHLGIQLTAERSSTSEKIVELTSANDSLNSLLASEKIATADKLASLALFETSWRESQHREEDLCRNIDSMKEQIDLLEAELEKYRREDDKEEALMMKIASLEKETEQSRKELEQLASSTPDRSALEVELNSLREAKNDVEAEYIRMANEVIEKEAELFDTLYEADAEILRLSRELELQQQVARMEGESLRDELKRLLTAGADLLPPVDAVKQVATAAASPSKPPLAHSAPPTVVPIEPEPSPKATAAVIAPTAPAPLEVKSEFDTVLPEDDNPDEPVVGEPEITKGLLNEFGSFCGSSAHSAVEFRIDPSISSVEYSDPAEVVAILYSSNSVQAIPDGSNTQRCKGYVIATHRSGRYSTYVAWYLMESRKVVFCAPEQQPADAKECTQFIADAIAYFEVIGLMMELEDLGGTVGSYNRAIRKVPALARK